MPTGSLLMGSLKAVGVPISDISGTSGSSGCIYTSKGEFALLIQPPTDRLRWCSPGSSG